MATWLEHVGQILSKVNVNDNGCWEYTGKLNKDGYGQVWHRDEFGRQDHAVHRIIFTALVEPIREGMAIDHTCYNKLCVNPEHLRQINPIENWHLGQDRA